MDLEALARARHVSDVEVDAALAAYNAAATPAERAITGEHLALAARTALALGLLLLSQPPIPITWQPDGDH